MGRIISWLLVSGLAIGVMIAFVGPATAQGVDHGKVYTKAEVEQIIKVVEDHADKFRKLVDKELDKSILDGTKREDSINEQVKDLEKALDALKAKFDKSDTWMETRSEVADVLREAADINGLFRLRTYGKVRAGWEILRVEINKLAGIYNLPHLK
ncbi:MAG: hypothetical protein AB1714_04995 [Acidobacteriota bacterium]